MSSNDERVDPVGACVGVKGSRVQAIVRELSGERIDIVPWIDEADIFISRALGPATVSRVITDGRRHHAQVIVEEEQLSLAIGKSGQNSRLAVQLTAGAWTSSPRRSTSAASADSKRARSSCAVWRA